MSNYLTMEDTIAPAVELASEANSSDLCISTDESVQTDWTQIMQSYDREYTQQVESVKDRMQRYEAYYHTMLDIS